MLGTWCVGSLNNAAEKDWKCEEWQKDRRNIKVSKFSLRLCDTFLLLYIFDPMKIICQSSTLTMAPTGIPQSSPNQSSEHTTDTKPEQPKPANDNPGETQPETAQTQLKDPSIARILQQTVDGSDKLTDPATEDILRGAT